MTPDLRRLLEDAAQAPQRGPDMNAIQERARTITWRRRIAAGGIALLLLAGGVALGAAWDGNLFGAQSTDKTAGNGNVPPDTVPTPDTEPTDAVPTTPQETLLETWFAQGEMLVPHYESHTLDLPSECRTAGGCEPGSDAAIFEAYVGGQAAVERLMEGAPTATPENMTPTSAIPEGTTLNGIDLAEDSVATVDLSSEFASGGGSLSMQMRVAQVVWTMTQFPTVTGVRFAIDGELVDTIGGEGIDVSTPQTRDDWMVFAPPIVVDSPLRGETVTSPVTISGTANVFEATVSIRIIDADGNVLAETFATATCGTGCRGDYSEKVIATAVETTGATIQVFESSAQNGEPIFMVQIPVTLSS